MTRVIAVGDIHGEFRKLDQLTKALGREFADDPSLRVVFLGDYINKGEDSFRVLDQLIDFHKLYEGRVTFLRGNHEDVLLKALEDGLENELDICVFENYHKEFLKDEKIYLPKKYHEFLRSTRPYHQIDEVLFVHGGIGRHGKPSLWEYGISGPLPEGIKLVIRGHEIKREVSFGYTDIAIDTGAYRKKGVLSALLYNTRQLMTEAIFEATDETIIKKTRQLQIRVYAGPWRNTDCLDFVSELRFPLYTMGGPKTEDQKIQLWVDFRNSRAAVNTYRVVWQEQAL